MPAEAGIHLFFGVVRCLKMDSGLRRNDTVNFGTGQPFLITP
jgi:hypothetical protein